MKFKLYNAFKLFKPVVHFYILEQEYWNLKLEQAQLSEKFWEIHIDMSEFEHQKSL